MLESSLVGAKLAVSRVVLSSIEWDLPHNSEVNHIIIESMTTNESLDSLIEWKNKMYLSQ
jgi:hypothetical protein